LILKLPHRFSACLINGTLIKFGRRAEKLPAILLVEKKYNDVRIMGGNSNRLSNRT
jgi:hypothetical protein